MPHVSVAPPATEMTIKMLFFQVMYFQQLYLSKVMLLPHEELKFYKGIESIPGPSAH